VSGARQFGKALPLHYGSLNARLIFKFEFKYLSNYSMVICNFILVLVLVVDERGSFSAIDAHIFPCLIQTVLEDVD